MKASSGRLGGRRRTTTFVFTVFLRDRLAFFLALSFFFFSLAAAFLVTDESVGVGASFGDGAAAAFAVVVSEDDAADMLEGEKRKGANETLKSHKTQHTGEFGEHFVFIVSAAAVVAVSCPASH